MPIVQVQDTRRRHDALRERRCRRGAEKGKLRAVRRKRPFVRIVSVYPARPARRKARMIEHDLPDPGCSLRQLENADGFLDAGEKDPDLGAAPRTGQPRKDTIGRGHDGGPNSAFRQRAGQISYHVAETTHLAVRQRTVLGRQE